jgi:hypothetical protein
MWNISILLSVVSGWNICESNVRLLKQNYKKSSYMEVNQMRNYGLSSDCLMKYFTLSVC